MQRRATVWQRGRLALLGVSLAACEAAHVREGARGSADVPDAAPPIVPASGSASAWVFAEDEVRTYELEMDPAEWAELIAHAREEQYRAATLRVEGEVVGQVGLRFKGGISSLRNCVDGAGNVRCSKLSMKIAFQSSNYSLVPTGTTPALGWDVALDGTRQEFEFSLRSATFPAGAPELPDTFDSAFRAIETLLVDPIPMGRNDAGYLGTDQTDSGQIRIDDIQLLP